MVKPYKQKLGPNTQVKFSPEQAKFLDKVYVKLAVTGEKHVSVSEAVRRCVDSCRSGKLDPVIKAVRAELKEGAAT